VGRSSDRFDEVLAGSLELAADEDPEEIES